MNARRVSLDEAIAIVGMVTRAITEDVRAAWRVCRDELRRRPGSIVERVDAALAEGRAEAGIDEGGGAT